MKESKQRGGMRAAAVLLLVLSTALAFSLYKIYLISAEYSASNAAYAALSEAALSMPEASLSPAAESTPAPSQTHETQIGQLDKSAQDAPMSYQAAPKVDFAVLLSLAPDTVGYIYCGGTQISYPVVQSTNNDYYLTHLYNSVKNRSGAVFMDYENSPDFSDFHTLVYAHHMKDGSMFACLTKYAAQSYYEAHPEMRLYTPGGDYRIVLFAGSLSAADGRNFTIDFDGDADRQAFIDEAIVQSDFVSGIHPCADDRLITLATCAYDFENARYTLHGVLIAD